MKGYRKGQTVISWVEDILLGNWGIKTYHNNLQNNEKGLASGKLLEISCIYN